MGMVDEFKKFALKGSVIDLAVGVVVGGAFGKIVASLVENIIMPPIGMLISNVNFTQLRLILKAAGADGKGEVAIGYGLFIQSSIDFIIIAFCLFIVVRGINRLRHADASAAPAAPAAPSEEVLLLRQIRDQLVKN